MGGKERNVGKRKLVRETVVRKGRGGKGGKDRETERKGGKES